MAVAEVQTQCAGEGRDGWIPDPGIAQAQKLPLLLCQLTAANHSVLLTLLCLNFSSWMAVLHFCVGCWCSGITGRSIFPFSARFVNQSLNYVLLRSHFWDYICHKTPALETADRIYATWGEDEEREEGGGLWLSLHMRTTGRKAQAEAHKRCKLKLLNFSAAQYTA